jgi:predicted dehydrogenase
MLKDWVREDGDFFERIDPIIYYMERQIEDFLQALNENRDPLVDGAAGRRTVELFTGIYRSMRDHVPVKFPLEPELGNDMDGRIRSN